MASSYSAPKRNGSSLNQRRRYSVAELLLMGKTLPFVCCPVESFKSVAWTENILVTTIKSSNPNEKLKAKMIATKLGTHRPSNLKPRGHGQEAGELLAKKRRISVRGASPKPRMLATIHEVPTPKSITTTEAPLQAVPLEYGLSGGYGKRIEVGSGQANNTGLTTSMHAFVPGGTLKTPPLIALNAGNLNWETGDTSVDYKMNTLSLADGLGLKRANVNVAVTPRASSLPSAPISRRSTTDRGKENARAQPAITVAVDNAAKPIKANLPKGTSLPTPRNLMNERSSGDQQRAWIDYMLTRPVMSASRSAPQIKEPLGASVDDDFEEPDRFKALDDFYVEGVIGGHAR